MLKRCFIIHNWGGTPHDHWYPWLEEQLRQRGLQFFFPTMPHSDNPTIEEWVSTINTKVNRPDEGTFLIGHSIGCQAILRYLETLPDDVKIGGTILVAPWLDLTPDAMDDEDSKNVAKPWIETPIDFEKVLKHSSRNICIFSDNDPYVHLSQKDLFEQRLRAKIIIERSKGHFTSSDDVLELQSVVDALLEICEFC